MVASAALATGQITTKYIQYNGMDMRTQRSNGSTSYAYVYSGSQLKKLTVGGNTLLIQYGTTGMPVGLTYNNTRYYYVTNLQGDVIAILNGSGTAVVTYTYDAWGNILTTTDTSGVGLASKNPLRYRGYVYDQETQLYYLQSRYYNPAMGRFINADTFFDTGVGLLGSNMFAYCNNNPSSYLDPYGSRPVSVLECFDDIPTPASPRRKKQKKNNDAAICAFYGVSSSDDIPQIPDGAMLFVENIISINLGQYGSIIRGKTVVMDRDKYCEYFFWGVGAGCGGIGGAPLDKSYTKGYVYGVTDVTDYCGLFLGGSSNLVSSVQGGAWAPSGVYAEIIGGTNVAASVGGSVTYYFTSQADWIYGSVDFYLVPNVYQTSPLNPNVYM